MFHVNCIPFGPLEPAVWTPLGFIRKHYYSSVFTWRCPESCRGCTHFHLKEPFKGSRREGKIVGFSPSPWLSRGTSATGLLFHMPPTWRSTLFSGFCPQRRQKKISGGKLEGGGISTRLKNCLCSRNGRSGSACTLECSHQIWGKEDPALGRQS